MNSPFLCLNYQKHITKYFPLYIDMHMKNVGIIITISKYNYKYKNKIR